MCTYRDIFLFELYALCTVQCVVLVRRKVKDLSVCSFLYYQCQEVQNLLKLCIVQLESVLVQKKQK